MRYPFLTPPETTVSTVDAFGGLNKTPSCPEAFFSELNNTSSRLYPLLSAREKRYKLGNLIGEPTALLTSGGITYTTGKRIYHNGVLQYDGLTLTPKLLVPMGSRIIVFPDGYYLNTAKVTGGLCADRGYVNKGKSYGEGVCVCLYPCVEGKPIPYVSSTPPDPSEHTTWLDDSNRPHVLKEYTEESGWVELTATHTCIEMPAVDVDFEKGDVICINGIGYGLNGGATVAETYPDRLVIDVPVDSFEIFELKGNEGCRISSAIPLLDHVCEMGNRLFGCRFGKDLFGNTVNEIYASKLGDPGSWFEFKGLSTDSFTASCGSEGRFTGIASRDGYVLFFKENRIHRLFGTKPSNFTLYEDVYKGIKAGCARSAALCNDTLYYVGSDGVYAYGGGCPARISDALGDIDLSDACACSTGRYYYLAATDGGKRLLYVYDTQNRLWHSSEWNVISLAKTNGSLISVVKEDGVYCLYSQGDEPDTELVSLFPDYTAEGEISWSAESGDLGLFTPKAKTLTRITLRLELEENASADLLYSVDGGEFKPYGSASHSGLRAVNLTLCPPVCDHLRIRLEGKGGFRLYSLSRHYSSAGEVV